MYKAPIVTGLRKGELASVTVGRLHLDAELPCIALNAADEKNRQGNEIMLRDDLANDLRQWLAAELLRLQCEARALAPTLAPTLDKSEIDATP
jgi:hypothetical protein